MGLEWLDLPLPPDDARLATWLATRRLFGTPLAEWTLLRPLFPVRRIYVHIATYQVARRFIAGKARSTFTFAALDQKVKAEMERHPEVQLLLQAFPEDFKHLHFNTLIAAFIVDAERERDALRAIRRVKGSILQELKEHRNAIDTEAETPKPWYLNKWVLLLAAA